LFSGADFGQFRFFIGTKICKRSKFGFVIITFNT